MWFAGFFTQALKGQTVSKHSHRVRLDFGIKLASVGPAIEVAQHGKKYKYHNTKGKIWH